MVILEEIKRLLREMNKVGYVSQKDLSDEQKLLRPAIFEMAFALFSEIKIKTPTYTIDKNLELKKYKVEEDESEEPSRTILDFLDGNSKAMHEMIGYYFFGKRKTYATENHLFHLTLFSIYSGAFCDIFCVSKSRKFWIVTDKKTEMPLDKFINQYVVELSATIQGRIEQLSANCNLSHDDLQKELNDIAKEVSKFAKLKNYDFQCGAITFMDFLGWKGLWQNRNNIDHLQKVSNLISEIGDVVQEYTSELFPYSKGIQLSKLISISDTIAIFTPEMADSNKLTLLELHARIARYILERCVEETYPIRGAIAFGKYNTKNNIMIGPGIDECASWHETCDWLGVHFSPSAELLLKARHGYSLKNIITYPVPVKKGYPKVRYCVDWKVNEAKFLELTDGVQALLPEIASKYMNTYDFLLREEVKSDGKDDVHKK
ncbi:MAG: hypothetical protein J1E64_14110 [Acetatifactor sp.]|nr:hypothetical protein [Acetatifactor sp.]